MTTRDAYSMFLQFLQEQGYVCEGTDCGSEKALIVFLHENRPFCIIITKNDEQLFEMVNSFGAIDPENAGQVAHALDICVAISRESKVVKAYLHEEMLIAAVEMFCCPMEQVKEVFPRCLQALTAAVATLESEMKNRPPVGTATGFRMGLASSVPAPVVHDLMRRGRVQSPMAASQWLGQLKQRLARLHESNKGRRT